MKVHLDVSKPRQLELFPLLLSYNYALSQEAQAKANGNVVHLCHWQLITQDLRWELEKRGLIKAFAYLKKLEGEWVLPQTPEPRAPQPEETRERTLN